MNTFVIVSVLTFLCLAAAFPGRINQDEVDERSNLNSKILRRNFPDPPEAHSSCLDEDNCAPGYFCMRCGGSYGCIPRGADC